MFPTSIQFAASIPAAGSADQVAGRIVESLGDLMHGPGVQKLHPDDDHIHVGVTGLRVHLASRKVHGLPPISLAVAPEREHVHLTFTVSMGRILLAYLGVWVAGTLLTGVLLSLIGGSWQAGSFVLPMIAAGIVVAAAYPLYYWHMYNHARGIFQMLHRKAENLTAATSEA